MGRQCFVFKGFSELGYALRLQGLFSVSIRTMASSYSLFQSMERNMFSHHLFLLEPEKDRKNATFFSGSNLEVTMDKCIVEVKQKLLKKCRRLCKFRTTFYGLHFYQFMRILGKWWEVPCVRKGLFLVLDASLQFHNSLIILNIITIIVWLFFFLVGHSSSMML